jgi:hypothetical protein
MGVVPCLLLNPLHVRLSSVETRAVMLQGDLFLPWMSCCIVHNKASGAPRSNVQHCFPLVAAPRSKLQHWFPLVGQTQLLCFLQHPRRQFPHLTGCGHCIWLIFVGRRSCDDFPCSVLLFLDLSDYTTVFVTCSLSMTQGNNSSIISLWHTMWAWNKECNINHSHKLLTTCKAVPKLVYGLLPILGLQWTQSYYLIC